MKKADAHCWGCPKKWFDKNNYMRCSDEKNVNAKFYFKCPIMEPEELIQANNYIPKIERRG